MSLCIGISFAGQVLKSQAAAECRKGLAVELLVCCCWAWVCAFLLAIPLIPLSSLVPNRKHCVLWFGIFQYITRACPVIDALFQVSFERILLYNCCCSMLHLPSSLPAISKAVLWPQAGVGLNLKHLGCFNVVPGTPRKRILASLWFFWVVLLLTG